MDKLAEKITEEMGFVPTEQQRALIDALARFCGDTVPYNAVFLLNGYAGTGKTSAALVKALRAVRRPTVLLAPTGRAAKVLSGFAGKAAMTIHRKIYKGLGDVAAVAGVADNPHSNAIFIVDEASMIGEGEHDSLLEDLAHYVYGSGHDCRMILLGDGAQLPPVGCDTSPSSRRPYARKRVPVSFTTPRCCAAPWLWSSCRCRSCASSRLPTSAPSAARSFRTP